MERIIGKIFVTVTALILCLALGTVGQAAVEDGVEVVHCFDDLDDGSGNGHNASTHGHAYLSDGMVYFDGTSDYVNVGSGTWSSNPCDGSSNFTIAIAYACTNTAQGTESLNSILACIGDPSAGNGHLSIFTNNNGQYLDSWCVDSALDGQQFSGLSFLFSDGDMHYCFITYNAGTDLVQLYALDSGSAVAGPSDTFEIDTTGSGMYPRLGMGHTPVEEDFGPLGEGMYVHLNGQIGYFAIWNRILTTGEMEAVEDLCIPPHPCRPSNVSPPKNEEHVDYRNVTLDWSVEGGCNPSTTYDVYFEDTYPPSLQDSGLSNTYWDAPSLLNIDTWYYWKIISQVPVDGPVEGGEWKFKTGGKAWNESPSHGQNNVLISAELSWEGDTYVDSYDVYFGTDSSPDAGEFQKNQPGTTFNPPGNMDFETIYYWRINEVIGGTPQTGNVWSFTTVLPPPDPCEIGFEEILFIRRPSFANDHFYTEFINYQADVLRSDNGIFRYNLNTYTVTPVITSAQMPGSGAGVFYGFDLDWDASRIVFDYKNSVTDGYRIWMCDIDGGNLTQITTTPPDEAGNIAEYWMPGLFPEMDTYNYHYDDMHPCFTQEDTIIFTSTRCKYTTLCNNVGVLTTPVLHRINLNGTGLEKLTDSPVSEFAPSMMSDGRVIYTRWEYVDKDSLYCKAGYSMKPDGTTPEEIFGLDQHSPPTLNYFRQVPTNPNKFVCVGAPHYWQGDNLGPILLINGNKEVRTHEDPGDPTPGPSVTYVTPNVHIWQEPGWNFWTGSSWVENNDGIGGKLYTMPYPLSERLFLVTCKYEESDPWDKRDAYDIFLIDTFGNHTQLITQPGTSCWNAMPLKERKKPNVINTHKDQELADANLAECIVANVYEGMDGVARGDVKYLRINIQKSRPWSAHKINLWGGEGEVLHATGWWSALWPRIQLGIVPVEEDGSAHFVVPADQNIFIQALDSEYRELQRERTYFNMRPGEIRACIGCHEQTGRAASIPTSYEAPLAQQSDPCIPAPMPGEPAGTGDWAGWGVKVLHYPYDIQPIFDSACVSCHSGGSPSGDLNLSGGITEAYTVSFESLADGEYCGPLVNENNDYMTDDWTEYKSPKFFGCYSSALADKLYNDPPHRARVTDLQLRTIFRWIDTNYSFYGTYYGRHHSDHSSDPDFRRMPTVEEALSNEPPSWHN